MSEHPLATAIKNKKSSVHSLESTIRKHLEGFGNCAFEWKSNRATEIIGQGAIKIDFYEQSEECLSLLSFCDLKSWLDAYLYGHWSTSKLLALVQELVEKSQLEHPSSHQWLRPLIRIYQDWTQVSEKKIFDFLTDHYNLSDLFFEHLLDKKYRLYTTALYPHPRASIEQAAQWQLQRFCEKLCILPSDTLLDLGSGWGALGIYAAEHYGCQSIVVSFSPLHQKTIERMIHIRGLSSQVEVKSYEAVFGPNQWYNKIAFLFPFDWCGQFYQKQLLMQASHHLTPTGLMLSQQIGYTDNAFGAFLERFMQDYVLSAYHLSSLETFSKKITPSSQCRLIHYETMDEHAARTLRDWSNQLQEKQNLLTQRGLDGYFIRLYQTKLALFHAGFSSRKLQYGQSLWAGPQYRGGDWLLSHAKSAYFPSPSVNDLA